MKKILLASLSMLTAVVLTTGCGGNTGSKKGNADTTAVKVPVKTMTVVYEDVERSAEFTSNVQAFKENNIAPSQPLRIDRLFVDVGAKVYKGQLLARMDPTQFNQTHVQLANLQADHDRMQAVYEAGGISKQQMDQSETQLKVQRDQLANLRTNIELRSPIDGVITARNYDAGDMYSGGVPIFQVMQINKLKVTASLSEQYFTDVKMGKEAEITLDIFPDRVFEGKVSLIYPAIDPATRTFKVEISIPNPKNELRPGMFSRTKIKFGTEKGLVVEDVAVQKQLGSGEKYVFVEENGKAVRKLVTTGRQTGNGIHILTGLSEGDKVITAGISKLMTGTEVEVKN